MKRLLVCTLSSLLLALAASAAAAFDFGPGSPLDRVSNAITEIDTARATELLQHAASDSPALTLERARLAVYLGECDRGEAILQNPIFSESREAATLSELAKSCARATAAGFVMEDKQRGIWLRLQDDADRALAPFIFEVAAQARDTVSKEVGIDMPRPLRIDLVRDLFSLSAVSGLPLKAAETTGTLAVARWGRVIMLSPRAPERGYPWQDTLAHEITHLLVTRATRDFAPLWMQEGLAKRFEVRWRPPRPFDHPEWADTAARNAALDGRSVGIDKLGPSIAMLPTPEAAGIAFAEVTSFMHFFHRTKRRAGAPLAVRRSARQRRGWRGCRAAQRDRLRLVRMERALAALLARAREADWRSVARAAGARARGRRPARAPRGSAGRARSRQRVRDRGRAVAHVAVPAAADSVARGGRFVRSG